MINNYTDSRYAGNPEIGIIGCVVANPGECMPQVMDLEQSDFEIDVFRNIFEASRHLYLENRPIDVITLVDYLKHDDYKIHITGAVEWLPDSAATPERASEYRRLMKTKAKRKRVISESRELTSMLEQGCELSAVQQKAAKISERLSGTATDRTLTAREGLVRLLDRAQKPKEYIKTGFEKLDNMLFVEPGDFVIIGGGPSNGKTALALQMAMYMAENYNVVCFSLETSEEKLFDRMIANYTGTPLGQIKNSKVSNWANIARSADRFSALKLTVVNASGWNVPQIRAKSNQLNADIIFVDYLGLLEGPGKTLYEKTTNISKQLHVMAQQTKTAVIALSQLNRDGHKDGSAPTMANLRESGQIEQDADVILLLHNPDKHTNETRDLIIAKNKEGRVARTIMRFDGSLQRFYAIENREG